MTETEDTKEAIITYIYERTAAWPKGKTAPLTAQILEAFSVFIWQVTLHGTRGDAQEAEGRVAVFLQGLFPGRKNQKLLSAMSAHERLLALTKVLLTDPDGVEMLQLLAIPQEKLDTDAPKGAE